MDLHKFEQHADWFVAINPEGQVPVLDHDGMIITHTTVINEYLEDVFPDVAAAARAMPVGAARMRYWNKFCDEQVMNYVSMHGWHRMVGHHRAQARGRRVRAADGAHPAAGPAQEVAHRALGLQRSDLAHATEKIVYAVDKVEKQLAQSAWIAGDDYTLADINFYSYCGMIGGAHVSGAGGRAALPAPRGVAREDDARPAVARALAGEDRTAPGLRTWTGHAR